MAFKMGRGVIEFLLKGDHLKRGIAKAQATLKAMQASMQVASRWARNLLMAMGVGFAYIIKEASSAEEIIGKFEAVFKEQARAARNWASDLARSIGRSKIDIMDYMSTLQDTFVPMGFARDKAREFSQQLVKLAIDLASFNNESEPEVIRALQSAIVGNHETMRRYGVVIMQNTLDQELLRMGFKGGAKAATEQAKAQARLNIIMRGTVDAQGDAARTAGSFANRMRRLLAGVRDLAVAFGTLLLPKLSKLVGTLTDVAGMIGKLTKQEMRDLLDMLKRVGKWLIAIWTAPMLTMGINSFVMLLGKVYAGLLLVGVGAAIAGTAVMGLGAAIALLAVDYALAAAEAAKLRWRMFQIELESKEYGRVVAELEKAKREVAEAPSWRDRLAGLRKEAALYERLVELEDERKRVGEEAAEAGLTWRERLIYAADVADVKGERTKILEEVLRRQEAGKTEVKAARQNIATWKERRGLIEDELQALAERARIEELEGKKTRAREQKKAQASAAARAKAKALPDAELAAKAKALPDSGLAAKTPRPEFVGLQEINQRLATAGTRRANDLARQQIDILRRTGYDMERTRQAVESMARTSTTPPASVIP